MQAAGVGVAVESCRNRDAKGTEGRRQYRGNENVEGNKTAAAGSGRGRHGQHKNQGREMFSRVQRETIHAQEISACNCTSQRESRAEPLLRFIFDDVRRGNVDGRNKKREWKETIGTVPRKMDTRLRNERKTNRNANTKWQVRGKKGCARRSDAWSNEDRREHRKNLQVPFLRRETTTPSSVPYGVSDGKKVARRGMEVERIMECRKTQSWKKTGEFSFETCHS